MAAIRRTDAAAGWPTVYRVDRARGEEPDVAPSVDRLVRALALTTFVLWLGASTVLPLLPEYLRGRGGSDAVVGLVMGAYFVAALLCQYPAGRLADR
ncbi:MAG TPA: MFS transporter, partial [Acidimicrobiales bacterium]|nr:MFS transporter [Acidimicrobiales bacterium]